MIYIKLFENYNTFVGIHCSPYSFKKDDFYGEIIDEYFMTFQQILEEIQFDYPDAKNLLEQINSFDDGLDMDSDESTDLVYEITSFFKDNNLEWIFVSKGEAMTKYGDNCYKVYFRDLKNVYSIEDELTDNAKIYIYNTETDKPILKKYS